MPQEGLEIPQKETTRFGRLKNRFLHHKDNRSDQLSEPSISFIEEPGISPESTNSETTENSKLDSIRSELDGLTQSTVSDEVPLQNEEVKEIDLTTLPREDEVFDDISLIFQSENSGEKEATISESELIEKTFSPRSEKDEKGFTRRIYTYGDTTFAFRGREELPYYQTLRSSQSKMVGDPPIHLSEEEFLSYEADVNKTEFEDIEGNHVIATKSLQGVVDLAITLGSPDKSLIELQQSIHNRKFSDRSLALLDALMAANYVDHQTGEFLTDPNPHAESLVVLGFLGDFRAQQVLKQKLEALRKLDHQRLENWMPNRDEGKEPLHIIDLVSVHATKYRPAKVRNDYVIPTTYDAAEFPDAKGRQKGGVIPRNTVHTTMNHKVADMFATGDWSGAGYAVVSPFSKMIESNGLPTQLNTVDTWWSLNPGEKLRFPDATLVEPGGASVETLYDVDSENHVIRYKSDGLRREDIRTLVNDFDERNLNAFVNDFNTYARLPFEDYLDIDQASNSWNLEKAKEEVKNVFGEYVHGTTIDSGFFKDFNEGVYGENPTILEAVRTIVKEKIAPVALKRAVSDPDLEVENKAEEITSKIMLVPLAEINRRAVNMAIEQKGFKVQKSGMYAWGDSSDISLQTRALANRLRIEEGTHDGTPHDLMTETYEKVVNLPDTLTNAIAPDNYNELIPNFDPQSRRVLYDSGLLVARN